MSFAMMRWLASSCGTNSCSGGSSRRMVTGRPSISRNSPSKSPRWIGSSLARALRRPASSSAKDHFAHRADAVALKKHVFGAAKSDTRGAEFAGHHGFFRRVGVGAHFQPAVFVGQASVRPKSPLSSASMVGICPSYTSPVEPLSEIQSPSCQVWSPHGHGADFIIHMHRAGARDTTFAHTARHNGCV
jgi:hypothetical protein